VERVTLYHRTGLQHLPLIEAEGLRARIDLSDRLGPLGAFDLAATGRYARGRRISGWPSRQHADACAATFGAGLVSFTVDPRKAVANLSSERERDAEAVWATVRPLAAWLEEAGGLVSALPGDLEVNVDLPIRAKLVRMHASELSSADLEPYARLVAEVADADRVAAKLFMHLALAVADGNADTAAYRAACALAWRDAPDDRDLSQRVGRADAEAVLEAVLADIEEDAPEGAAVLVAVLDALRSEADAAEVDLAEMMMDRSERSLAGILAP